MIFADKGNLKFWKAS